MRFSLPKASFREVLAQSETVVMKSCRFHGPGDDSRSSTRRFGSPAILIILLLALQSVAAEPPPAASLTDQLKELSVEELLELKVATVYGASKHEQKVTEAPSSVSLVTADEIKKQGYRTLGDILRNVRGFYVTYDRGYNAIGVDGVNRPGDYGGRLLLTIDGHRLNDPLYDVAASEMDFLVDVDLIERVEIIRGPGSSLYGNNAFFGVVNVVTRKGGGLNGTELSTSAGGFDTYTGRVSYGTSLTNGVELLLSGSLYDSAGDRRLVYPEFSRINRGVAENMDGSWARSAFAGLSWKDFSLEGGFVDRRKTWPTAPYSTDDAIVVFNDPRFFTADERGFAELRFQHTLENEWEVMVRGYYDHYRYDGQYPYDYLDPLYPVTLNRDVGQAESVGGEAQFSKTLFEKHRVTLGAEARDDWQLTQQNFDLDPWVSYLKSGSSAKSLGLYAQDEFQVSKTLILNSGVRYDNFSTFGDTVNPRVGLIYAPWVSTAFKFLYGQAFRGPNAYEYFYESVSNKRNPHLNPERIRTYELVYEQSFNRHWTLNASLFLNDIQGLIGYRQDPADGLFYFDNLQPVDARGGEIEINGHWANGLRARASYIRAQAEDAVTGVRLNNSPEHLVKLELSLPLWRDKVFASVDVQGMSERRTVRGELVSGFWVANATLFSRELLKGLELSASVYNLGDERYRDPVATDFSQNSIQQDGRSFRVKLTYHF